MNGSFVYIYGLDRYYRIVNYRAIRAREASNLMQRYLASKLKSEYPQIESVYSIVSNADVYSAFKDSIFRGRMENLVEFKVMLELDGICLI